MEVRVIQSGNDAPAFEINDLRVRPVLVFFSVIHADDAAILDGEIGRFGIFRVERGNAPVVENEIGNSVMFS